MHACKHTYKALTIPLLFLPSGKKTTICPRFLVGLICFTDSDSDSSSG